MLAKIFRCSDLNYLMGPVKASSTISINNTKEAIHKS